MVVTGKTVPPVGVAYHLTVDPDGAVALSLAIVPIPQKDWLDAAAGSFGSK